MTTNQYQENLSQLSEKEILLSISQKLNTIETRLDKIEEMAISQSMNGLSMALDSLDEYLGSSPQERSQSYDSTLEVLEIMRLLKCPQTLQALRLVLENAPLLATSVEQLKEIPNLVSIAGDSFDQFFAKLSVEGIDIEKLSKNLSTLAGQLADILENGKLNALLDSDITDHSTINFARAVGRSVTICSNKKIEESGPLEVIGGLFDSDIRRSLGFFKSLAKHLGEQIKQNELKQIPRGLK